MATATILEQETATEAESGLILTADQFDVGTHNGMVTVHNPATGNHRTFRVETREFPDGAIKRVVSLLIGPDREDWTAWRPFGFAVGSRTVAVWRKYQGAPNDPTDYQKFARMLERPDRFAARGLEYLIEARCRRCNRPLTRPDSIASGLGPVCAGRD